MKNLLKTLNRKWCVPLLTAFLASTLALAENNSYWNNASSSTFNKSQERKVFPDKFLALHLDINSLRTTLAMAPKEFSRSSKQGLVMLFPMPDGSFKRFSVFESEVMHPKLAAKYPQIKTFEAQGIDDAYSWMRLDLTYLGFHAMISTSDGFVFIDPVNNTEPENYICYYKRDMPDAYNHHCSFENSKSEEDEI